MDRATWCCRDADAEMLSATLPIMPAPAFDLRIDSFDVIGARRRRNGDLLLPPLLLLLILPLSAADDVIGTRACFSRSAQLIGVAL